jgi:excisionase family DNA binding protein
LYLTPKQAAAILNVSTTTARDYARRGVVPARKIGKHWRFLEADLLAAGAGNGYELRRPPPRELRGPAPTASRVSEIARRVRAKMKNR